MSLLADPLAASLSPDKVRSASLRRYIGAAIAIGVAAAGFFFPLITGSSFYTGVAIQGVIVALGAIAVAFLLQQCGLAMFGIAGVSGGAAYLMAIGVTQFGLGIYGAIAGALIVMLVVSACLGYLIVRTGHLQFAMVTLAMAQMLRQAVQITSWRGVTGGDDGITLSYATNFLGLEPQQLSDPVAFWPVAWAALCVAVLLLGWAVRSRLGTLLRAIRDNEERMRFSGYNTLLPRLAAFVLACLVASLSGILTALYIAYVSPELLDFAAGGHMLTAALVGGIGTIVGPAVGGVLFGFANDIFSASGYLELLTGLAIVIAMTVFPENRRSLTFWKNLFKDSRGGRDAGH